MADSAPLLSPAQRKLAAAAIGLAAVLVIGASIALIVVGLSRALGFFSSVLWPVALAGILALMLRPVVDLLERRLRLRRPAAVIVLFAGFILVVGGAVLAVAPVLIAQTIEFAHTLPQLWEQFSGYVEANYPDWIALSREKLQNPAVKQVVDAAVAQGRALLSGIFPGVKAAVGGIIDAFGFTVSLAIVPVYLFFFLLSTADVFTRLRGLLPFLRDDVRDDVVFLSREFAGIIVAFFRGQLLICLIMGVAYALGFSIGGLKFGLVIGLSMGLLNVVPYLGTMLGLAVALPLAFFQPDGGVMQLGIVLAVFAAVQALEGWILTPRIMGHQTGLHPVAIIFSVLFWGKALSGILGMVLAIPLTAFVVTAWRLAKHKYFEAPPASR